MDEAGIESYYIQDDLGIPMALLNQGGIITDAYAFDEFGTNMFDEDVDEHEKSLQSFGYTGLEMIVVFKD